MQFEVHTTLGSVIAGPLSIVAERNSSAEYIFEIVPPEIDHYKGLLVFAGRELYKTNNPDYDSDHEDDFNGENGEEGIYLHIFKMWGLGRLNRSCGV